MGNYFQEEEEEQFFDTREDTSSVSDSSSVCSEECDCSPGFGIVNGFPDNFDQHKFWSLLPETVDRRRRRFRKWMGRSLDRTSITREYPDSSCRVESESCIDRSLQDSGAVLRTSGLEEGDSSNRCFVSFLSNGAHEPAEICLTDDCSAYQSKNLDGQMELFLAEQNQNGLQNCLQGMGSSKSVSSEEFETTSGSSPMVKLHLHGGFGGRSSIYGKSMLKQSWLRKLGAIAHIVDRHVGVASKDDNHDSASGDRMKRVRVQSYSKRSKELSSLYCGQEFTAHEGSILTMKFSLDGKYLATAGEDGIVRVWKIFEDESLKKFDIQDFDSSCLYFRMNNLSRLIPLNVDKEHVDKIKKLKRSSDSTCVIFPPKIFRILEKPVHEFQGHTGEILSLSWSKKGFLLSSSADNTVRLWQVGTNRCLRVFSHNNYVTCVAFNPMDDNYFISGSIDGKVRIWEVLRCCVVDYTDIRDIVTAVCYRPDGKGGIVGSMTGNCYFYDVIDNRLQLDARICLKGKKKLPGKRITGFEFFPSDPSKVIISSADSLVRVLSGRVVLCKIKSSGFRIASSQISATFSQDGKQIISASEDSNVYIWNYNNHEKAKGISSCESFVSHNASVAIPWCGIETIPGTIPSPELSREMRRNGLTHGQKHQIPKELEQLVPQSSPDCFSLTRVLLESLTRGTATWPEEALPNSSPATTASDMWKFELKVLKSAYQSMLTSHKWGLVIVTASWDGSIRTYLNYGLPIRL